MYTTWTFDGIENKYHVFRDENCTKRFFESFREHEMKIIHLEKKKMIPLTNSRNHNTIQKSATLAKKIRT